LGIIDALGFSNVQGGRKKTYVKKNSKRRVRKKRLFDDKETGEK